MKSVSRQNAVRGFTLTEILVVLVIAGILLALSLGLYGRVKGKQTESRLLAEMAAIELGLENFKAKHDYYPPSSPDWGDYPFKQWGGSKPKPPNRLYKHLCNNDAVRPFLKDGRNSTDQNDPADPNDDDNPEVLLSTAPSSVPGKLTKWSYNSYNPKYNKNTYDLWVEYGDLRKDGLPGGSDNVVKVISNWSN